MINLPSILLWGFVATAVLTSVLAGSQGLGLTRISLPFLLGTIFTPGRDRAMVIGTGMHMLVGWAFALIYALAFESIGRASWWIGLIGGGVHGLFVLTVVMPVIPGLHPRMVTEYFGPTPNRQIEPPGFMGLHYGRRTPVVALVAHMVYGGILGAFYHLLG